MTREEAIADIKHAVNWAKENDEKWCDGVEVGSLELAIEALRICGNFICAERLREEMYHQAFEVGPEGMVRWDSGLWIRYKLFEDTLDKVLEENEQ